MLKDKIAIVTGGTRGIGYAIVEKYLANHAVVVLCGSRQETADKAVAALKAKDPSWRVEGIAPDLGSYASVKAAFDGVRERHGRIDILVNNAGIIKRIPMTEMTAAQFRQVIDIDLNGPFIVSKAVIPSMIKKGHGKIINICSMMSELGRETVSAYASAKGGLKMLTKNICSEYGQYNIQCNGLGPGYIETPQSAGIL